MVLVPGSGTDWADEPPTTHNLASHPPVIKNLGGREQALIQYPSNIPPYEAKASTKRKSPH